MKRLEEIIKHYLLIFLTLSFLTGILLYQAFPLLPRTAILLSCLLLFFALLFSKTNKTRRTTLFLLLTVISLGFLHTANFTNQALKEDNIFSRIVKEENAVLTGTLHRIPLFDGKKSTVIIKSHSLRLQHEKSLSRITGLVQLSLKAPWPASLVPGSELVIRTRLSRPYRFGNPGGFDYPAFLASQNIRIVGRISSTAHIHPLHQEPSWLHSIRYLPERIRSALRESINNSLPKQEAGVYRALLIGDRSGLSKLQLESFKASGVFHILAISGLHLSLVATTLFGIFYWLARRSRYLMLHVSCKKLALLSTIPPLCAYALLAGSQTPILRSLIMVLVFILAFCVQRQRSPFTTLSFAALLILLLNPLSLFTVSFQLSFSAVASLIVILPRLKALIQRENVPEQSTFIRFFSTLCHWIIAVLLVSVAATIGTAPLLIHSFNRISTVGPVVNLLLEPLLCLFSLPFGLLAIPFLSISPHFGQWLLQFGGMGITTAMNIADFFGNLSVSTLWLATPSFMLILLYYCSLVLCLQKFPARRTIPLFCIICGLFYFPPQAIFERYCTKSEITFLDVGQGSSTLLRFPGGKNVLIDGGGSSSTKFNVGESIIAPFLWYKRITHLDAVVITHPDADHFNGIPFILKRFKPDILWVNGDDGHDQGYDDLLNIAADLNITIREPEDNELLFTKGGAALRNIGNPLIDVKPEKNPALAMGSNDQSLILHFTANEETLSCLFPGDISRKVEKALLAPQTRNKLQASILLSPHHGSKTSNSSSFLKQIAPRQIVVSAGRFQPLLFPSTQLRSYCREKEIPLLNTAEIGAITIRMNENRMAVSSFQEYSENVHESIKTAARN